MKNSTIWYILLLLLSGYSIYSFAEYHEFAHKSICESFGGTAIRNGYKFVPPQILETSTSCVFDKKLTALDYQAYQISSSNVESTYVLVPVILSIYAAVFLLFAMPKSD